MSRTQPTGEHKCNAKHRIPSSRPNSPFPTSGSDSALKQARGLLSEWETRAAYVREIRTRIEERKAEVGQLESEYHAELRRCAEEGIVSDKDEALLAEIRAFAFELRDIWDPRLAAARELAMDAAAPYYGFIDAHGRELVEELAPDARRVTQAYAKEYEAVHRRLHQIQDERASIATAARAFTGREVPDDPRELPLPRSWAA